MWDNSWIKETMGQKQTNATQSSRNTKRTWLLLILVAALLTIIAAAALAPRLPPGNTPTSVLQCESLLPPDPLQPSQSGHSPSWTHYNLTFKNGQIGHLCRSIEDRGNQVIIRQEMTIDNLTIYGQPRNMKTSVLAVMSKAPPEGTGPWTVNRVESLHCAVQGGSQSDAASAAPPMFFSAFPAQGGSYSFQIAHMDPKQTQGPKLPSMAEQQIELAETVSMSVPYLPDVGGMAILFLRDAHNLPHEGLSFQSVEPLSQNVSKIRLLKDTGSQPTPGNTVHHYRLIMDNGYSSQILTDSQDNILKEELPMGIVAELAQRSPDPRETAGAGKSGSGGAEARAGADNWPNRLLASLKSIAGNQEQGSSRKDEAPDMVAQTEIPLQMPPETARVLDALPQTGDSGRQKAQFNFALTTTNLNMKTLHNRLNLSDGRQTPDLTRFPVPEADENKQDGHVVIAVSTENLLTFEQLPSHIDQMGGMSAPNTLLAAEPGIESDNPAIQKTAIKVAGERGTVWEKAERLTRWVHKTIRQTPVVAFPSASETLRAGKGDCNDQAVLLTALLRAAGIPAQPVYGLKVVKARQGDRDTRYSLQHHAWVRVYLLDPPYSVEIDPSFNQIPADALRVRLAEHSPGHAGNILAFTSAIKSVKLELFSVD